ncbi:hypothetical protein IW245_000133 [Longispora fulva]|uniref:Uncharacterized protein n=1 Tax=Longispora fulva TaxID=619741 RepID=A0A8J7KFN0_9ACTN|nr:hypothetical protein [Longispora fulva]
MTDSPGNAGNRVPSSRRPGGTRCGAADGRRFPFASMRGPCGPLRGQLKVKVPSALTGFQMPSPLPANVAR